MTARLVVGTLLVWLLAIALGAALWPREARVVGARRALVKGTRLTLSDIAPVELEAARRPAGCVELGHAARVIGATLARDVEPGEPITEADVLPFVPARGEVVRQRRATGPGSGGRPGRRRAASVS